MHHHLGRKIAIDNEIYLNLQIGFDTLVIGKEIEISLYLYLPQRVPFSIHA
jgi:hypothetical protein